MHGIAGQIDMIGTVVDKENDTVWGQTDDKSMLGELVLPNWLEGHYQMVQWHSGGRKIWQVTYFIHDSCRQ